MEEPSTGAKVKTEAVLYAEPNAVSESPSTAAVSDVKSAAAEAPLLPEKLVAAEIKKWPGWPGDNVFRMVVPVVKVGSLIGKKGELIKKLCEDTRAKIRVLDGVAGTTDRIVLIFGKEEPEAELSPAMDAVIRVFKRVSGAFDTTGADEVIAQLCSVRLLVPSAQAISLIGKQGSLIKSIQETTGATIRVLTGDELPYYASADERAVDIQGESPNVLKALESVVSHLRKFLVDRSVLPLFEKSPNAPPAQGQPQAQFQPQECSSDAWSDKAQSLIRTAQQAGICSEYTLGDNYTLPLKRDSLFLEHESLLDSQIQHPLSSLHRPEPPLSSLRSTGLKRSAAALITQVTQTMQIPLSYAEDIIGSGGGNIAYIRRSSGAVLTVQESGSLHDEITVEIKGTSAEVQNAQQLIQEFIAGHKEPTVSNGSFDTGLRPSSFSHLSSSEYTSSSLPFQSYGGYGSGLGGYGSYRF